MKMPINQENDQRSNGTTKGDVDEAASNRRQLLKRALAGGALGGLAASLPSAWHKPLVQAVVLPAHAQTSSPPAESDDQCSAPAGCYLVPGPNRLFSWPGGVGPVFVRIFDPDLGLGCDDAAEASPSPFDTYVVAASEEDAIAALGCEFGGVPIEDVAVIQTEPALPDGCDFYACD